MTVTPSRFHWKFKPLATVDAAGVQNTWYTVLDTVAKARLYSIYTMQVNDEAAAKAIETKLTIDGISLASGGFSHVNNTAKAWRLLNTSDVFANVSAGTVALAGYYTAIHAKSLKVEVRNTDAAGTNQHLYGYVRYAKLEAL